MSLSDSIPRFAKELEVKINNKLNFFTRPFYLKYMPVYICIADENQKYFIYFDKKCKVNYLESTEENVDIAISGPGISIEKYINMMNIEALTKMKSDQAITTVAKTERGIKLLSMLDK